MHGFDLPIDDQDRPGAVVAFVDRAILQGLRAATNRREREDTTRRGSKMEEEINQAAKEIALVREQVRAACRLSWLTGEGTQP